MSPDSEREMAVAQVVAYRSVSDLEARIDELEARLARIEAAPRRLCPCELCSGE